MASLLFVCTGNQCRSPMAAAIAAGLLSNQTDIRVFSAGTMGGGNRHVTADTAKVLARRGIDTSPHRSRALEGALSPRPDVVIAMAREHARAVVEADPNAFACTFTLKDLVRRAAKVGPRAADESIADYLRRLGEGRGHSALAGSWREDDIADPIRQPSAIYERCAAEIEDLVTRLVGLLWPRADRLR